MTSQANKDGGFEKSVPDLLLKSVKIIALRRFVTKLLTLQFNMEIPISGVKVFSFSDPRSPKMVHHQRDPQKALHQAETRILSYHTPESVVCSDLQASRRNEKIQKKKVPRIFTGFCDPWYSATVGDGGLIFGIRSQRHGFIIQANSHLPRPSRF